MVTTAILVDGGFYRKRAKYLYGTKTAEERADELEKYCKCHIQKGKGMQQRFLYRIFYYDCLPLANKKVFHPLKKTNIDLDKSDTAEWSKLFIEQLKTKRKFAVRLGELSEYPNYNLKPEVTRKLLSGKLTLEQLTENDFSFNVQQKGVDMRIGIDIASLTYKKQVNQIILISGDSDFVPAAKMARREGVDFILDSMGATIKDNLFEHIDGLESFWKNKSLIQINGEQQN